MQQTLSVTANIFQDRMQLPVRPIQSITSITYFDGDNASQTLATSIYELDTHSREIRLKYLQNWPTVAIRWDAITITFVAGYVSTGFVPAIAKQAILLQVGRMFEDREMMAPFDSAAYDSLARKSMRWNYP